MSATATFITDLLDHHLDELGFLWAHWRAALRDPDYTLKGVGDLEERIRGHLDGVRVPGERSLPRLLELLEADDPDLVFAAAYSLLHTGSAELIGKVLDAFVAADDEVLGALCTALAYGPLPPAGLERVRALLSEQPTIRAILAAEVLTFHRSLELTGDQLRYFVEDEDAAARRAGWRVAALMGAQLAPKSYANGLRDEDPAVTSAALEAGAWCGQLGVLSALRHVAEEPTPEKLGLFYLLAVLGGREELPLIEALVGDPELGPGRFRLAGAFGAPELMGLVLTGLEEPDAATAAAAGAAFVKMTGKDIESDARAPVPPADGSEPDELDIEFLDEVTLPDAERARREWDALVPAVAGVARLCRGMDVGRPSLAGDLADLDMESRWEARLRSRFHGVWTGSALDIEVFPQGRK